MTSDPIVSAIAGLGLPGTDLAFPRSPLGDDQWTDLLASVNEERLWGLLSVAIEGGQLPASVPQRRRAAARHRLALMSVLELESMAVTAFDLLGASAIEIRLLKGLAVAHLDETDPAFRCFRDVDLLVRGVDVPAAVAALSGLGYSRDLPERRPGFDRRFAKEVTLRGPNGREIDLHRTLAAGAFGLMVDEDDLWSRSDAVRLAGRDVPALDPARRLLHAAYAAALEDPEPRVVLLRDVGLLLNGDDASAPEGARRLATEWGAPAVLAAGITLAADRFGARDWPLQAWAATMVPSARERVLRRAYRSNGGTNTQTLLSGLLAPADARSRLSLARGLVLPDAEYRRARLRAGRPAELRTGIRELLGGRSRRSGSP